MTRQGKRRAEREQNKITEKLPSRYAKYENKKNRITGSESRKMQRIVEAAMMPVGWNNLLEDVPYDDN